MGALWSYVYKTMSKTKPRSFVTNFLFIYLYDEIWKVNMFIVSDFAWHTVFYDWAVNENTTCIYHDHLFFKKELIIKVVKSILPL